MSLRKMVIRLENALAPTRKLPKNWKPTPKKPKKTDAPAHHTPSLANKVGASTTAPTRKVAPKDLPKSPGTGRKVRPGYKMVFGRLVKTGG